MFSAGRFDAAFAGALGQAFGYRKATRCPCFNEASGQALPTCQICMAKGVFWAPETTQGCFAGMTSQTQQKGMSAFGEWSPGDATLTIPGASAMYGAGHQDRFRCLDATSPFSTILVHDGTDVLLGTVQSISRVCWIDPTNPAKLVEGGIPKVSAAGALTWSAGEPPADIGYSISGVKWLEFYAWLQLPAMRDIGQVQGLPKKLAVRRFDLFGR